MKPSLHETALTYTGPYWKINLRNEFNLRKAERLWAKEFLTNIRMEIRNEFESLKESIHNLNRRFDELEKQNRTSSITSFANETASH